MVLTDAQSRAIHESLERASREPSFLDAFYADFMQTSSEVAAIFAHTDMERLKRKLKSSLHVMTLAVDNAPGSHAYLAHLGKLHEGLDIEPHLYSTWLDSLIAALTHCDPLFDSELEQLWRSVVGQGIEILRNPYLHRDSVG